MNAIDLIRQDHRTVEGLFSQVLSATEMTPEAQEKVFQDIETELTIHAEIEEQILYPAVEPFAKGSVDEAIQEHAEVKELLAQMLNLDTDAEAFDTLIETLVDRVNHHVEEEEAPGGILDIAQKHLSGAQLRKLGTQMEQMKRSLGKDLAA